MKSRVCVFVIVVISLVFVIALAGESRNETEEAGKQAEVPAVSNRFPGVSFDTGGGSVRICFFREAQEKKCFLFLPSFAAEEDAVLSFEEEDFAVFLDGKQARNGQKLKDGDMPQKVKFLSRQTGSVDDNEYDLICMRSENIPAVFINTENLRMEAIDADKEVSDKALLRAIDPDGSLNESGSLDVIRARGNSSFQAEKKSYRIRFSRAAAPFGMASDRSFILQANAYDNTRIRNTLALTMADRMGLAYTPKFTSVDLYLNDEYAGNYLFMESVKVAPGRVDIAGDGSYLFEVVHDGKRLDEEHFSFMSGGEIHLQVLYPEVPDAAAKSYCESHMNRLDRMIEDLQPGDDLSELSGYVDLPSFVNMFLFDFITNDIDAGNYSSFSFIDSRDGKVHLGPVWDYDKAWGNEKKRNELPEFNAYSWRWPELPYDNISYSGMLKDRLPYLSDLTREMLDTGIDEMSSHISASVAMDVVRRGNMGGQSVNEGSLEEDINQLKDYMKTRLELLDGVVNRPGEYCRVYIKGRSGRLFWVKKGSSLSQAEIDFALKLYGCDSLCFEDGSILDESDVINEDCVVLPE